MLKLTYLTRHSGESRFGLIFFVIWLKLGVSLPAGSLILAVCILKSI